jgi:hypothetical protein
MERFLVRPTLKRGVLLAAVFALLFLAGVPQYVFCVGLIGGARLALFVAAEPKGRLARAKIAGRGMAWLALGLGFCAPQLFPTLELVGEMHRDSGEWDSGFSLSWWALMTLIYCPARPGEPGFDAHYSWEWCGFIGGGAFLLGAAAFLGKQPQRYFWIGIAGAGLILALGAATPAYEFFLRIAPGAALFRAPGRYLLLFTVAAAALAAAGVQALWDLGNRPARIGAACAAMLCGIQLLVFARPHFLKLDPKALKMPPALEARLRNVCAEEGRVASGQVQDIGLCQAAGLDHLGGYEPMMLRRYAEVMNAVRGSAWDFPEVIFTGIPPHPVARMLGARAACVLSNESDRPDALPRAWLVNNAVVFEDKGKRLHTIGLERWDPGKTVILESFPNDPPPVPTETIAGRAKLMAKAPGFYEIEAENDAVAYLVLSEAYYPGWTAEVDGNAAEILPANHLIQTIRLPAGKHLVRFRYRSRFLVPGFAVSVLAALVPLVQLVRRNRRQLPLQSLPGAP